MRLPAPLSRNNPYVYKNNFGHVLILAGSRHMLGAGALTSFAALRSGAGLVTLGVPRSLNSLAQKKISNCVMTLSLPETKKQSLAISAFKEIQSICSKYNALAIGPGLGTEPSTQKLILKIISCLPLPMVIDADALTALIRNKNILNKTSTAKILTPHPGEMARMLETNRATIEADRHKIARNFVQKYNCTLLLKGHHSVIATKGTRLYINKSGNAGMATAGSGDVLSGMLAAFLAQGLSAFNAAKYGAYLHGKAGDLAAKAKTRLSMVASDIIDFIPNAVRCNHIFA